MLPTYHQRDSSTGGKMPVHGPRRVVKPGFLFNGDFEIAKPKITVSKSEMKNYQAICNLATSEYSKLYLTAHWYHVPFKYFSLFNTFPLVIF